MIMMIVVALMLTAKAIQVKRLRLLPMCVFGVLYDIVVSLYLYPPDALIDHIKLITWAEYICFILVVASVFYASLRKNQPHVSVERMPVILAAAAVVLRIGKTVYSRLIFAQMEGVATPTEAQIETIKQSAVVANLLMRGARLLIFLILLKYMLSLIRQNKKEEA